MTSSCVFCRIARGDLPAKRVLENDTCVAFWDIQPKDAVHLLIIPKQHIEHLEALDSNERATLLPALFEMASMAAKHLHIAHLGYQIRIHTPGRWRTRSPCISISTCAPLSKKVHE